MTECAGKHYSSQRSAARDFSWNRKHWTIPNCLTSPMPAVRGLMNSTSSLTVLSRSAFLLSSPRDDCLLDLILTMVSTSHCSLHCVRRLNTSECFAEYLRRENWAGNKDIPCGSICVDTEPSAFLRLWATRSSRRLLQKNARMQPHFIEWNLCRLCQWRKWVPRITACQTQRGLKRKTDTSMWHLEYRPWQKQWHTTASCPIPLRKSMACRICFHTDRSAANACRKRRVLFFQSFDREKGPNVSVKSWHCVPLFSPTFETWNTLLSTHGLSSPPHVVFANPQLYSTR